MHYLLIMNLAVFAEVTEYRKAIEQGAVEAAFNAAVAVRKIVIQRIEGLTDSEYEQLMRDLPGIILNRDEVVLADPDPTFFLDLARKRGDAADVAFFENYKATFPVSVWPVWVDQQTDVTGCIDYAGGQLVQRYAGWRKFRAANPGRYKAAVTQRLREIEEAAADATCACGTKESARTELERFVKAFPDSLVTPRIRRRIEALRSGASLMQFNCESG